MVFVFLFVLFGIRYGSDTFCIVLVQVCYVLTASWGLLELCESMGLQHAAALANLQLSSIASTVSVWATYEEECSMSFVNLMRIDFDQGSIIMNNRFAQVSIKGIDKFFRPTWSEGVAAQTAMGDAFAFYFTLAFDRVCKQSIYVENK